MATREIQTQIGPESLQRLYQTEIPSAIEGVPGPTLMEVIPTPETVKYQQQVIQNLPGGERLSTVMGERKVGLEKALKEVGLEETPGQFKEVLRTEAAAAEASKAATTGKLFEQIAPISNLTPQKKGEALLGALGKKFDNARKSVNKVWSAIPEDEILDIRSAQEQVAAYKANLTETEWEDLPGNLKNWINSITEGKNSIPRISDKELAQAKLREFTSPEYSEMLQTRRNATTENVLANLQKEKAQIEFDYSNPTWDLEDNSLVVKVSRNGTPIIAPDLTTLETLKQKELQQASTTATQTIEQINNNEAAYLASLENKVNQASDIKNNFYTPQGFDQLRKQGTRLYKELSTKSNAGRIFGDVKNIFLNNITAEGGGASKALPVIEQAVKAERAFSEVFREGVVGTLSSKRFNKLKTLASDAVDKVLAKPEYVTELQQKLGKNADEVIVVRQELLNRLSEQKDGNKFINKHIDLFKNSFGDDLEKVRKYANAKMRPTGYESYASVADVSIPKMIFESEKSINDFMTKFGGTGADEIAKNKFVQLLLKDKNPLDTLTKYEKGNIPQTLYGEGFADVKSIIEDLARTKAPRKVEAIMTGGQSATQSRNTAIAAVKSARDVFRIAEKGTGIGAVIGTIGLQLDKMPGSKTLGAIGALIGNQIKKIAATRETEFNAIIANMLANPEMIRFAKLPPTPENTKKLLDVMVRLARDTAVVGKGLQSKEVKKED
jgi:NurA-like 5'-3' nuclease